MNSSTSFNDVVAFRTAAAEYILAKPDVLEEFLAQGGLKTDLEMIRDTGRRAEAVNVLQMQSAGAATGVTAEVLEKFAALQRDYKALMAVVQAVLHDMQRQGVDPEVQGQVEFILRNEAQVAVSTGELGEKKFRRSVKQEAIRAEIAKDARALLELPQVHPLLAARRKPTEQLSAMLQQAEALTGEFSEKTTRRGSRKAVTAQERDAVKAQRDHWGANYRILARVARLDGRVAELLKKAAR